jgi:hypothetical protein
MPRPKRTAIAVKTRILKALRDSDRPLDRSEIYVTVLNSAIRSAEIDRVTAELVAKGLIRTEQVYRPFVTTRRVIEYHATHRERKR